VQLPIQTAKVTESSCSCSTDSRAGGRPAARTGHTRRSFLRTGAAVGGGLAALGASLSPLLELRDREPTGDFFQKHYKEMTPEQMETALNRIRSEVEVYALNLSRCNGNRRCVHACVAENNQSRDPEMQYIRVIKLPRGTFNLEAGEHHYDDAMVPDGDHYYLPVQCPQCASPPCTKVCPVEATWTEPDGITVIDYDWCIGCRYCEAACPYWARRFNFAEPRIPEGHLNPDMSYLSNRPRPKGSMEKCTYCLHRTREGRMPACLEACPTGARKFGNVLDPQSEVSQILRTKRVFVLKEEANTLPRFFYYFDERYPRSSSHGPGQLDPRPDEHGGAG
jgi:molybdopterin-containing oxidoreductase family iron-sulfur binding subunit